MIVQCPSCASRYRIRDANIPPSGGKIRCPSCSHSFIVYPEANEEGEDATSITSRGEISQLVNRMEGQKQGQGPSAADEDYVQTQVASGDLDEMRAMQAMKNELGDPMDMDGTVEIQNPMKVWKEAQQAMQAARAKANAGAAPDDPTGDEYDHAATEVVDPQSLNLPFSGGGQQNAGQQNPGPPPQRPPLPTAEGPDYEDDDPTFLMEADVAQQARARDDSSVGIDPAGNGSGVNQYARNTPPSGRTPSSSGSQPAIPESGPPTNQGFERNASPSGLQSSDLFDQPVDDLATVDSGAAATVSDQTGAAGSSDPDPDHPGPWKLKTNFGLTYEFPDTRSLSSWLSSRDELDGYTVSADDGNNYFQLGQFPQLQPSGSGRRSVPSGNFSVPPSHGSGLTPSPMESNTAPRDSSPSIDRPPPSPGPQDDPFQSGLNQRPSTGGQPALKGPRVNTEFRPPSRESKYQGLLWFVFFLLFVVAVGVGVHTFGIFDIVGAFNQYILGKDPEASLQVTPPEEAVSETETEAKKQPVDEDEMRKEQEREVAALLEDAQRLIDGNKLPAALEKLETTLHVAPENPRVYEMMADVHERLGQADEATKAETKAEELRATQKPAEEGAAEEGAAEEGAAEEGAADDSAPDSNTE